MKFRRNYLGGRIKKIRSRLTGHIRIIDDSI